MHAALHVWPAVLGLLLASGMSQAALIDVDLKTVTVFGGTSGSRNLDLAASTATWQYDESSQRLIQTAGIYDVAYRLTPTSVIWDLVATEMILGPGPASASSFACVEGNFGALVGSNFCAGYSFGPNFVDESTSSWGPGLTYSRSIGGDDYVNAGIFTLDVYSSFRTVSWDGSTLQFANAGCFGATDCSGLPNGWNGGYLFVLETTPVPAPTAIWLFGSALGVMGYMRRQAAALRTDRS